MNNQVCTSVWYMFRSCPLIANIFETSKINKATRRLHDPTTLGPNLHIKNLKNIDVAKPVTTLCYRVVNGPTSSGPFTNLLCQHSFSHLSFW